MFDIFLNPETIAALLALITLEIVLGIDNLIFISIVTQKLPEAQQPKARRIGIGLALILRLVLLTGVALLVGLSAPIFDLGITGPLDSHGLPAFETAFSWRDLILISGGLFLIWKATTEIHHKVDPEPANTVFQVAAKIGFGSAIVQIIMLDAVFSVDSILTAVGMTPHIPVMVIAVLISIAVMFFAAEPVANFINNNPTVVMLALAFLIMIGVVLIADGFGHHIPKGYVYTAMAFAMSVEFLNMLTRKRKIIAPEAAPKS